MKILLNQDVKGTGKAGEIVEVSNGYARNYILPQKLGIPADAASINAAKIQKSAAQHRKNQEALAARELAEKLKGVKVTVPVKVGENGKLFGSVTSKEIAAALKEQKQITLDRKKIALAEAIRAVGTYQVNASVYEGVAAQFQVEVTAAD